MHPSYPRISYAIGDFVDPITSPLTGFDTANYTLPEDIRTNNSVYNYKYDKAPRLLDEGVGDLSVDGHDHRSDFNWIITTGYNWVIADATDHMASLLEKDGKRNISHLLADGKEAKNRKENGWYRRHVREFAPMM